MADSVLKVFTRDGMAAGIGEVIAQPDEGMLYLTGEDGTHTVFNLRHVISYVVRPYRPEEAGE